MPTPTPPPTPAPVDSGGRPYPSRPSDGSPKITLARSLGLLAAVSIIIGNVVGTGVFLKARVMTCNVGTPGLVIGAWVAAGLLSLAGALTYAELAALWPRAGGEYVFVREAYGPRAGFLYGWMQIFIAKTGSQASVAVAFAIFLNDLTGGALEGAPFAFELAGRTVRLGAMQLAPLALIALTTLLNCAAVAVSGWAATVLTGVKIALVLGIGLGGLWLAQGDWANLVASGAAGVCERVDPAARSGAAGFGAAMLGALWGYDGWNNLTLVAGEIKDPERNVPRALVGGTLAVVGLYVFVNVAYFYVLSPLAIASVPASSSVAREVTLRFLGPAAAGLSAAGLVASSIGTLHTSVLTGARIPYAMARDGLLFRGLARLDPRTRVPVRALALQGVWASLLALSGSFDALTDYVLFGSWIFYALVTGSVFLFRRRLPHAQRPYRAWGYPVVPALFLVASTLLLVNTLFTAPRQALVGLLLIGAGLPVYYAFFRHRRVGDIDWE
ncbi:MAG TPA: amino acid permease [Polyangiaceae bacterium]|nr:amino acid permease [Polyangiaceae bacterium]